MVVKIDQHGSILQLARSTARFAARPVFSEAPNAKPLDQAGHGRTGRRVLHQRESMRGTAPKPPKRCLMRLPNAMPGFSTAR
jgi:hypothetical protein